MVHVRRFRRAQTHHQDFDGEAAGPVRRKVGDFNKRSSLWGRRKYIYVETDGGCVWGEGGTTEKHSYKKEKTADGEISALGHWRADSEM